MRQDQTSQGSRERLVSPDPGVIREISPSMWGRRDFCVAPTLTPRRVLALYVSFSSLQKGQLTFSLLLCLPRRQCASSLQTQCVRWQRSRHSGPTCSSSFCPVPVPLWAAAHPSRAGRWPPSLLRPSRSSCWRLWRQQGEPAGQRGLGAPWCWPGEQLSLAAQIGVLAQGPTADSSPGASPSHRPASALLATRRYWYCRHRPPRVPVPPAPGSGTTGVWREGWDLGGSGSNRKLSGFPEKGGGGSQLCKPSWLPFDPQNPLSRPGTLFLCPPAPPNSRAWVPHSWLAPSIPAVWPQKAKATS